MKGCCKAVKVADKVYWVGAIDWDIRDFHGYSTNKGTTYNAYLILSEKPVLVDAVKAPFKDEMMLRIASLIDPKSIKTVVSNHAEMDHSGALPQVLEEIRPERVLASQMGVKALQSHFRWDKKIDAVKDGETIDIGGDKITFTESRMLHWPDSMISFLESEKVMFSNDIFGMHFASSKRFEDEVSGWEYEAAKYYANIVLPYSEIVKAFAAKLQSKGITPSIIAPDHGPIWRKDVGRIVGLYGKWASNPCTNKAVVVYDTMWNSTAKLALAVADGLMAGGTVVKVMPLHSHHRSDVMTELLDCGALIAGAPTLNQQMFPTMADFLTYFKGLKKKGLIGNAFGSYGWGGESVGQVSDMLAQSGVQLLGEAVKCQYAPDQQTLEKAFKLGADISAELGRRYA